MKRKAQSSEIPSTRRRSTTPPQDGWRRISQRRLINTLNRVDFLNSTLTINLKHPKYNRIISLDARPQPCVDDQLLCRWSEPRRCPRLIESYEFLNFFLTDGLHQIFVEPDFLSMDRAGIHLRLPEHAYEISERGVRRYACTNIDAQISQSGVLFTGQVQEFSVTSLKIDVSQAPVASLRKINPSAPVSVVLCDGDGCFYSGECTVLRHGGGRRRNMVVAPSVDRIQRFLPKEYRSIRQELVPSPNAVFRHPCTGKTHNLRVIEVSGCGFSVEEDQDNAVLLPGMMLPMVDLEIAGLFRVACTAQVIYTNQRDGDAVKRSGMAILDMDVGDQIRLSSLLHQALDRNTYVCSVADLDALWEFFFETGFVYPEKYSAIQSQKERFQELYRKLYTEHPEIAVNFTYQQRGKIYGHMAMCRFYSRNWIIHHHAAITSGRKAGIAVLEQIGRYVNEVHRLHSAHMDYVSCYFRPENKFPNLVFGGAAKKAKDPKGCSVDAFAYFHYDKSPVQKVFPANWSLQEASSEDLEELEDFYEDISGGLMLEALDLVPDALEDDDLTEEYEKLDLERKRFLYSLKAEGELKAVIMITVSDIGLNMSDLTNCFHVIVLNPENLGREELLYTLFSLSHNYEPDKIPVLIYPEAFVEQCRLPKEKTYNFWVLNIVEHIEEYFRHLDRLTKRMR